MIFWLYCRLPACNGAMFCRILITFAKVIEKSDPLVSHTASPSATTTFDFSSTSFQVCKEFPASLSLLPRSGDFNTGNEPGTGQCLYFCLNFNFPKAKESRRSMPARQTFFSPETNDTQTLYAPSGVLGSIAWTVPIGLAIYHAANCWVFRAHIAGRGAFVVIHDGKWSQLLGPE